MGTFERRQTRRFPFRALVRGAGSDKYSDATMESINISSNGVMLSHSSKVLPGETIEVLFTLPGRKESIEARCTAIHSLEAEPGKRFIVGAELTELRGITREELAEILEQEDS
jgi:hypothetical protein